jgi:hypothetical protein
MRRLITVATACFLTVSTVSIHTPSLAGSSDIPIADEIIFPFKVFYDVTAYVQIHGTLFADWLLYKPNTYSISCDRSSRSVAHINQVEPKTVDAIYGPIDYPVTSWSLSRLLLKSMTYVIGKLSQ